jgi:hypothetical protein
MALKWKKTEELPMDEAQNKKLLLLSEGRISGSTTMHVSTDYWHVFFDDKEFNLNIYDKKKKHSPNCFSYGRFGDRKIPLDKIKGWMYADDLINLYDGIEE